MARQMIFKKLADTDDAREIHGLAFPGDEWVGDDHTFWVLSEAGKIVGMCSAIYYPDAQRVFLSRCAVVQTRQGIGLQRRMIRARVEWAKKQGAVEVVTYTLLKNYESMVNLLRSGFKFYYPVVLWAGTDAHYFRKSL